MRMTINAAIVNIVAAHVKLDKKIKVSNKSYRLAAEQPIYRNAGTKEHIQAHAAVFAAGICQRTVRLGAGIGVKNALKAAAGKEFERIGLHLMARGRSGTLLHLAGTASMLAVKVALFHLGTKVVAPLVGLVCGLAAWGRAEPVMPDNNPYKNYGPHLSPSRSSYGHRYTSAQTANAMTRQAKRTAEAISPGVEAVVVPLVSAKV